MGNCGSGAKKKGDMKKEDLPKLEGISKKGEDAQSKLKQANMSAR